jgi:hypothetical protein
MFRQKEKPTVSYLLAVGICMPDLNLVRLSQQPPCARRHVGATTTNAGNRVVARHREPDSMGIETHLSNEMCQFRKSTIIFVTFEPNPRLFATLYDLRRKLLTDFHRSIAPSPEVHST